MHFPLIEVSGEIRPLQTFTLNALPGHECPGSATRRGIGGWESNVITHFWPARMAAKNGGVTTISAVIATVGAQRRKRRNLGRLEDL